MTPRSEPGTTNTGPLLSKPGTVVRVIRPAAGWIRTSTPSPRPNSSQPAVAPSNGWPTRLAETTGVGDTVADADVLAAAGVVEAGVVDAAGTRAACGPRRSRFTTAMTPRTTTAITASVN